MKSSELSQKAFSGSIHQYIATVIITIFSFLTSVYVIRELTVEEFGFYHVLLSILLLAQIATSLGLANIIQRYLPEYREKKNNYIQKRIVALSMCIRLLAGLIFVSILLVANNWIVSIFNLPDSSAKLFPVIALIILLALESNLVGNAALIALFENRYWNLSISVYTCLKFILFYFSLSEGYGIAGIVWSWLIAEILLFLLFLLKAYKVLFSLPIKKEEIQPLPTRRFVNFGAPLFFAQSSYFFRDKAADVFLLSYFIGTHAVGLYSFAFGIPLMVMSFSPGGKLRAITTTFLVHTYTKTNDKSALSYFFKLMNKVLFFSTVPIFIILMILADKVIIYIFNPEYLEVLNLFILSLGFLMVQQFKYAYTSIVFVLEKSKIIFWGSLAGIYNIVLDIILIPYLGILGAILATGSAGIILLLYYYVAMRRVEGIELKYPLSAFARFSINTIITAVIVFLMRGFINNIPSLISVLAIAVIVYLGLSYLNKGFEEQDRKIFNDAIGKDIFVF